MPTSDDAWLARAGRALGGAPRIVTRAPLAGGYAAAGVERIDLDVDGRRVPVVLKSASRAEVAAMRAVAVVGGAGPAPLAVGDDWLVLPFVEGSPPSGAVPDPVWEILARVHAHWWRKRPRGIPVVDPVWWAALCDRTLVAVRGAAARTGDPVFAEAEEALRGFRADPRIAAALAVLPRTLVHGDAHRGNVLGATLIDWGNARVAPAGLDLATLRAQGEQVPAAYRDLFDELRPGARPPAGLEEAWGDVHVNVAYLGFAADHLGAARVAEMVDTGTRAVAALDVAWRSSR